jgi:hypothetical protein
LSGLTFRCRALSGTSKVHLNFSQGSFLRYLPCQYPTMSEQIFEDCNMHVMFESGVKSQRCSKRRSFLKARLSSSPTHTCTGWEDVAHLPLATNMGMTSLSVGRCSREVKLLGSCSARAFASQDGSPRNPREASASVGDSRLSQLTILEAAHRDNNPAADEQEQQGGQVTLAASGATSGCILCDRIQHAEGCQVQGH